MWGQPPSTPATIMWGQPPSAVRSSKARLPLHHYRMPAAPWKSGAEAPRKASRIVRASAPVVALPVPHLNPGAIHRHCPPITLVLHTPVAYSPAFRL
jgi:hypothetical protein